MAGTIPSVSDSRVDRARGLIVTNFIDGVLRSLPKARTRYYSRGFQLPSHCLSMIESMRLRPKGEKDFQFFLDEVFRESIHLKYPWQPRIRTELRLDERSDYIEMLSLRHADPSAPLSLDPNFELFAKHFRDDDLDISGRLRSQKLREQEQHISEFKEEYEISGLKINSIFETIGRIGFGLGYQGKRIGTGGKEALEFVAMNHAKLNVTLRLVDLRGLRKNSQVFVQYYFVNHPNKAFGLGSFVPGGNEYSVCGSGLEAIIFAFYAQVRFITDLRDVFE